MADVEVVFAVEVEPPQGFHVRVAGGGEELGAWQPTRGVPLTQVVSGEQWWVDVLIYIFLPPSFSLSYSQGRIFFKSHTPRKFSAAGILDFKMKNLLVKNNMRHNIFEPK